MGENLIPHVLCEIDQESIDAMLKELIEDKIDKCKTEAHI